MWRKWLSVHAIIGATDSGGLPHGMPAAALLSLASESAAAAPRGRPSAEPPVSVAVAVLYKVLLSSGSGSDTEACKRRFRGRVSGRFPPSVAHRLLLSAPRRPQR